MGDSEDALPPLSKKRAAGREISKDDPGLDDEEDFGEQETGTFKRASDEVLATRRIVKVRRSTTTTSSNPFAGICLVAPSVSTPAPVQVPGEEAATSEKATEDVKNDVGKESGRSKEENCGKSENKIDESASDSAVEIESAVDKENVEKLEDKSGNEKVEGEEAGSEDKKEGCQADNEDKKGNGDENVNVSSEGAPLSSFQQLSSSKNAFTGLAGTGLSTSAFSFGSISKDGSSDPSSGPLFGQRSDQLSFGFGRSANGSSSLFGTSGSSIASKSEGSGFVTLQDVPAETGEENERVAFSADSMLFEFIDGGWKERGKGEVKVNVSTSGTERARLLMRARGNFRLILNASLYPDMKLTNMDKKGITFACINSISEGKDGLSTFALKFKDIALVDEFRRVVTEHKGKAGTALKTPENSPKASDK